MFPLQLASYGLDNATEVNDDKGFLFASLDLELLLSKQLSI